MAGLEGRVALVTGGAGAIGLAIGRALAAGGARVALVDLDRGAAEAQTWVAELGLKAAVLHDKFEVCAKLYGAAGESKTTLPRTFLVDEKGRVRAIYSIEGSDLEAVIEADLKAALAAPGVVGASAPQ